MQAKTLTKDGIWVMDDDVQVEFTREGKIILAKAYNHSAMDFEPVDLDKISNHFKKVLADFVESELAEIEYSLKFPERDEDCA